MNRSSPHMRKVWAISAGVLLVGFLLLIAASSEALRLVAWCIIVPAFLVQGAAWVSVVGLGFPTQKNWNKDRGERRL